MTYQVSSLLECEPTPCLNFHHKPDLSGPVSILAITDNAHIWQNRARCAPLMDTARGTLYSVPRIELQVEVCLHMRGLFCIDHCQWNGLRFPNICSIKVPFFILDSLSGNSSIRWSLAAFCAHFLKKYALCCRVLLTSWPNEGCASKMVELPQFCIFFSYLRSEQQ